MDHIEEILSHFPYTLQLGEWLSALSTILISLVSLWLAFRAQRIRFSAYLDKKRLYEKYGDASTQDTHYKKVFSLEVCNEGLYPIYLDKMTSLLLKIPFTKHGYDTVNLDIPDLKTSILPGDSKTFLIGKDPEIFFKDYFQGLMDHIFKGKRNKLFLKIIFRWTKFHVRISSGKIKRAQMSCNLKRAMLKSIRSI